MKKKLTLILCAVISLFLFNRLEAQTTLRITAPSTAVSESIVTFTIVGETPSLYVRSVPNLPDITTSPASAAGLVIGSLWDASSLYKPGAPTVAGKFSYKFTSTSTSPVLLNLVFSNVNFGVNGGNSNGTLSCSITITPKVAVPTPQTHYYYFGNSVTYAVYTETLRYDRYGPTGSGISGSGPRLLKEVHYNAADAAVKFGITDHGDAYDLDLSDNGGGVVIIGQP